MKLPLKLPSKATLTERARKRLDEAKLFEKEFLDCIAKRGLRYAMSVKSPLTIAASLEVYGQVVNALTLPESKATPESLYEYVLKQVTDLGAIEKVVDEIIAANPDQVAKVQAKPTLIGWFVGQAMKASGGKANPQALNDILKQKLGL